MMVAFGTTTTRSGSLYYSREIPSLLRGLRVSKLYGREGIITFESNGGFVLVARQGPAAPAVPGVPRHPRLPGDVSRLRPRDPRRPRAGDEPRARDRGSAADGPDLREPSSSDEDRARITTSSSSAAARAAARWRTRWRRRGARILVLERGDLVPQEDENWSPAAVWKDLRYRTTERVARRARRVVPALHALLRRRQHQVLGQRALPPAARGLRRGRAHATASRRPGRSTTTRWRRTTNARSGCTTCTVKPASIPPSRRAARFRTRRCRTPPACTAIVGRLRRQGLHPSPLPLGLLRPGEDGGCVLCNTCNSFPCKLRAKSDADVCCVRPALQSRTSRCGPTPGRAA